VLLAERWDEHLARPGRSAGREPLLKPCIRPTCSCGRASHEHRNRTTWIHPTTSGPICLRDGVVRAPIAHVERTRSTNVSICSWVRGNSGQRDDPRRPRVQRGGGRERERRALRRPEQDDALGACRGQRRVGGGHGSVVRAAPRAEGGHAFTARAPPPEPPVRQARPDRGTRGGGRPPHPDPNLTDGQLSAPGRLRSR